MTNKNPKHIAIIMDGNRRWARENGLPSLEGHRVGYGTVKKVVEWCRDRGIKFLTVWAFSTENWNRSKKEVDYLMRLTKHILIKDVKELTDKGVRLNIFGRLKELPKSLQEEIRSAIEKTKDNTKTILNIAFNYGGRAEIIDTVKKIVAEKLTPDRITEAVFEKNLYSNGVPDPDLIIRTSGEQRLSGFLPWQGVYAELYFCKKYWPDFSERDFDKAIESYQTRQRRFGG